MPHEPHDFARLSVSFHGPLGKHLAAVGFDFEHAAGRFDELHLRIGKRAADLGRQTGGPRFVVSDDAVFDDHAHTHAPRLGVRTVRIVALPTGEAKGRGTR